MSVSIFQTFGFNLTKVGIRIPFGAAALGRLPTNPPSSSRHNHWNKQRQRMSPRNGEFHIRSASPCVHHKVDGGTTTKYVSNWNDRSPPGEMLRNAPGIQL